MWHKTLRNIIHNEKDVVKLVPAAIFLKIRPVKGSEIQKSIRISYSKIEDPIFKNGHNWGYDDIHNWNIFLVFTKKILYIMYVYYSTMNDWDLSCYLILNADLLLTIDIIIIFSILRFFIESVLCIIIYNTQLWNGCMES